MQLTTLEELPSSVSIVPLPLSVTTEPPPPPQGALHVLPSHSQSFSGRLEPPALATAAGSSAPVSSFAFVDGAKDEDSEIRRSISMQEKRESKTSFGGSGGTWPSEDSLPLGPMQSVKSFGGDSIFPDLNKASVKIAHSLKNFNIGNEQKKTLKKSVTGIFTNNGWNAKPNENRRPSQEIVGNVLDEITTLHSSPKSKPVQESKQDKDKEEASGPEPTSAITNFTIFSEEGNASPRIPTIRFLSPFGVWMDRFRIILGVWTVTYTPMFLAFQDMYQNEHWSLKVIDVACDLIFLMGVLLAMVTTVGSVSAGREYLDPKVILLKRLRAKTYWMDVISCLPFVICLFAGEVPNPTSSFLRSICWLKLLRIHWVISMPASHFETRFMSSVQVFRMFVWICLSMHLMACLWYVIVVENGTLERHLEDMSRRTPASDYLMAFKYGSYMVTGKPVVAYSDDELLMIAISSPLGGILFAFIYGNTTMLVTRMSIHMSKHHKHIALIRSTMRTLDIPVELRQRITKYHHFLAVHHNVNSYALLMQGLSVNLFIELKAHLFKKLFSEGPFFQGAPGGFLRSLVQVMVEVTYCPGDVIIRYGDLGDQMYFVVKGRLDVLSPANLVIGKIQENMYFGEIALLISTPRLVSIRAATYCLLAMISRDRFIPILEAYPEQRQRMLESMKAYKNFKNLQPEEQPGDDATETGREEDETTVDEEGNVEEEGIVDQPTKGEPAGSKEEHEKEAYSSENEASSRISDYASELAHFAPVAEDENEDGERRRSVSSNSAHKELLKRNTMPVYMSTNEARPSDRASGDNEEEDTSQPIGTRLSWDSESHGVGMVGDKMKSLFHIQKRRLSDLKGVSNTLFGGRSQGQRKSHTAMMRRGASICEKVELTNEELTEAVATGVMMQQSHDGTDSGVGRTLAPPVNSGQRKSINMGSALPSANPSRRTSYDHTHAHANTDKGLHARKHLDLPRRSGNRAADSNGAGVISLSPSNFNTQDCFNRGSGGGLRELSTGLLDATPRGSGVAPFDEPSHGPGSHGVAHGTVLEPAFQHNGGPQHDGMKWSATGDLVLERIEELSHTFCNKLEDVEERIVRRVEERFDPPLRDLKLRVHALQRTIDEIHFNTDLIQNLSSSDTVAGSRNRGPRGNDEEGEERVEEV